VVTGGKRTAAGLGAWLCFEDESGQGLGPPRGCTWGRRGCTPVVRVTGGSNKRVSLAALIAIKPGCGTRLIYRVHAGRSLRKDQRKGFTETDYARLLDAAHQQLGGPLVVVWDNLNTHVSRAMAELIAARDWLTVCQLPPYAHELNPAGPGRRGPGRQVTRGGCSVVGRHGFRLSGGRTVAGLRPTSHGTASR
jgi:hypothetical protein